MYFVNFLLKKFIKCKDINALKLCLLKIRKKEKNLKKDKLNKIKFILKNIINPIISIKFKKKNIYDNCFIEPSFKYDKELVKQREDYLFYYLKKKVTGIYWTDFIIISNLKDLFIFFKYYYIGIFISFLTLLDFSGISLKVFYSFIPNLIMLKLLTPKHLYMFNPHDINNYLLSLYFNKNIKIIYNLGNSALYDQKRYGYFKNLDIILCSKAHLNEFRTYEKIGWIKEENCSVQIWGNEYINEINKMDKKIIFDLAYYSSGEWARDGMSRTNDIDGIKNGKYIKNHRWKLADKILSKTIEISKKYNLSLKIYSHPYEKKLLNKHNIKPPYFNKIDEINIFSNVNDNNIKSNIFEAKIGVTYFTSTLYDRLNYDLDTLFFTSPKDSCTLFGKYLTDYEYLMYKNIDEFENKLKKLLKKKI